MYKLNSSDPDKMYCKEKQENTRSSPLKLRQELLFSFIYFIFFYLFCKAFSVTRQTIPQAVCVKQEVEPWSWKFLLYKGKCRAGSHLVVITGEAAAFHGAGIVVAFVVELAHGSGVVDVVHDGRKTTSQRDQRVAATVDTNTHTTLRRVLAVSQQGAAKEQLSVAVRLPSLQ